MVKSIYQDQKGILGIGTDGGLNRFDANNNTFKYYRSLAQKEQQRKLAQSESLAPSLTTNCNLTVTRPSSIRYL
ncbi:MAG: hypothetical protein HRT35_22280 [Algicola sp.]|nr:hypothetical protein [Algicola sp.]